MGKPDTQRVMEWWSNGVLEYWDFQHTNIPPLHHSITRSFALTH
jgi:hypothetical protein